jgi:hypothetical protein
VTNLVRYEAARTALAEAHRIDEVKDIRDTFARLEAYGRVARDTELIQKATDIKVRATRRLGEMMRVTPKNSGTRRQLAGRTSSGGVYITPPEDSKHTLTDHGIDKNLAKQARKLAAMPAEHFETALETAKATADAVSTAHMLRLSEALARNAEHRAEQEAHEAKCRVRNAGDPVRVEAAAWDAIEWQMKHLIEVIGKAACAPVPACSPERSKRLAAQWRTVSEFLSTYMIEAAK